MNTTMNFLKPLDWITCRGYYVFRKDRIPQGIDVKEARSNFWKNLLYVVVILVLSVAGVVLMQEHIKSQGIVFGLLFNVKRGLWFFL